MAGLVCVVRDLYLEGFVDQKGLDPVPGLHILLLLLVLMKDLALEDSVLEGFAFKGFSEILFLLLDQLLLLDEIFWILLP